MDAGQIVLEILVALAMLAGTFFMVVTGIGLVRFPDVYTRMHAAGKAGTIGIALLILAPTLLLRRKRAGLWRCAACSPSSSSSSPRPAPRTCSRTPAT